MNYLEDDKDIFMPSDLFLDLQRRLTNYRAVVRGERGLIGGAEEYNKLLKWAADVTADMQERRFFDPKPAPKNRSKIGREAKAIFVHQCLTEIADIVYAGFVKEYATLRKYPEAANDLAWGAAHKIRMIMEIAAGRESVAETQNSKTEKQDHFDAKDILGDSEEELLPSKHILYAKDENLFRMGGVVDDGKTILGYVSRRDVMKNVGGPISYMSVFPAAENHALARMMQIMAQIPNPKDFMVGLIAGHLYGRGCTQSGATARLLAQWWQKRPDTSPVISDELNNIISAADLIESQRVVASTDEKLFNDLAIENNAKKKESEKNKSMTRVVLLLHPDTVGAHQAMLQAAFDAKVTPRPATIVPKVTPGVSSNPVFKVVPPQKSAVAPQPTAPTTAKALPISRPVVSQPALTPLPPRVRAKPIPHSSTHHAPHPMPAAIRPPDNALPPGINPGMVDAVNKGAVAGAELKTNPTDANPVNSRAADVVARLAVLARGTRELVTA